MSWDSLVGNDRVKSTLKAALAEDRLAHGFIFSGPDGLGKRQFALTLAKAVNCEREKTDSCDRCAACHKIDAGEHIDVRLVEPDKTLIKIGQIRELVEQANYRPFESRKRVFILESADQMNEQAANALLKTLEEPPETSLVILITRRLQALLPTVRSRCQIHHFTLVAREEVEAYLRAHFPRPEGEIRLISRLCQGRIGYAVGIDLSVYRGHRKETLELVKLLISGEDRVRLIKAAEYLGKRLSREEFDRRMDVLNLLVRDIYTTILDGDPTRIVNTDLEEEVRALAGSWSLENIERLMSHLETLRRNLQQNVHRQIGLEEIFLTQSDPQVSEPARSS